MTDSPFTFNLWSEPWIRATRSDGSAATVGIGACLAEAHTLAALSDPSPLVVAGTHRLLVAVLQAIYSPQSLDDIAELLEAGSFDIGRLGDFAGQYGERFDLFHPTAPFLQTGDVPLDGWRKPEKGQERSWSDPKPIAALFAEVPAETNRAHYHHVTDESHRVCPACCARGIVTVPAFASSGGAGIRPSINGVPPVYMLPAGVTLHESLALSLVTPDYQPPAADRHRAAAALWNGAPNVGRGVQVSAVGYLESLTFPARRMRLYPQAASTHCTQCGAKTATAVGLMLYEMGHWLSEGSGTWGDPFAALRQPGSRSKSEQLVPIRPQEGKALWREYSSLLLAERPAQLRPLIVRQTASLVGRSVLDDSRLVRFRGIGIRTDGKAKIFEWLDEALDVPPALLVDPDGALVVETTLQYAADAEFALKATFDGHLRPERASNQPVDQRIVRFKTLRARMVASFWERLAPEFRSLVPELAASADRDAALRGWGNTVVRIARRAFDEAAEQVGTRADALKARVEAQAECARRLAGLRTKWLKELGGEA